LVDFGLPSCDFCDADVGACAADDWYDPLVASEAGKAESVVMACGWLDETGSAAGRPSVPSACPVILYEPH